MTTLKNYHLRMQRVLDYIDAHLDDDLDLDTLSGVAAFSKFHFHRQFKASFGLSVHRYVQLARMRRASFQLAHSGAQKRHGYRHRRRLRRTGRLRPRLSTAGRAVAFIFPEVSRLGPVAYRLWTPRPRKEHAHENNV